MIKLSKSNLGLLVIASIALLYVYAVTPDLERPLTLFGFFVCIGALVFMITFQLLRQLDRRRRGFFAVVSSISVTYMFALSSLNTLNVTDILMVAVVTLFSWVLFRTIVDK